MLPGALTGTRGGLKGRTKSEVIQASRDLGRSLDDISNYQRGHVTPGIIDGDQQYLPGLMIMQETSINTQAYQ